MAYPTDSARTKTWTTEVMLAADLHTQYDLLHDWVNAAMDGTSGHGHTGGTNDGPQLSLTAAVTGVLDETNGGTGQSTITQGDVLYGSAANTLSKLGAGTAGQALTTGGAGANPSFSGMTTSGDVEYHNGTTRTRLAKGTDGDSLVLASGLPSWGNAIAVKDYGTSASTGTAKNTRALYVYYGQVSITNNSSQAITNLPFTSTATYVVTVTYESSSGSITQNCGVVKNSGSQCTIYNNDGSTNTMNWIAIGT